MNYIKNCQIKADAQIRHNRRDFLNLQKVRHANSDKATKDDTHSEPAEPLQLPLEEDDTHDADKDEDGASEHLK